MPGVMGKNNEHSLEYSRKSRGAQTLVPTTPKERTASWLNEKTSCAMIIANKNSDSEGSQK